MTSTAVDPWLGPRFEEALGYALRVHGGQVRKGTTIPYVSHLLDLLQEAERLGSPGPAETFPAGAA